MEETQRIKKKCFGQRNSFECHNLKLNLLNSIFFITRNTHIQVFHTIVIPFIDNEHCIHSVQQLCVLENKAMHKYVGHKNSLLHFLYFFFCIETFKMMKI